MSRTLGIPTYAFNPAPQFSHRDKSHPESKIIKTRFDYVSLLPEPEKTKIVKSKFFDPHSMDNFLPPKTPKRTVVPKIERQKAFFDSPKRCLENPQLPECRGYYYI